ncbi:cupin domain-containing protein [Aeromicrobium chenweiae]|uniref:LuxR family transcriptional regulator n=1 Tax=Aeromicrobium chenweiae TaxID=2079793 RepID=A0A2S0WP85_9ACTN|nr:cupin domain-containing protein [Aeromicrobium chenweiae]AWB93121.1 LuxR family transcriptional regulator [Aeromicrobium chenweiae]TGN34109.1 LuxR family transcriptional regulator [Aeromicrobium chenweiae]
MHGRSLLELAENEMAAAREATSGRAATTIYGGQEHDLRQTLIALVAGRSLGEHDAPGEATLQVLSGEVRLNAGDDSWDGATGDYLVIPPSRHDLLAVSDAVVLLTVATGS